MPTNLDNGCFGLVGHHVARVCSRSSFIAPIINRNAFCSDSGMRDRYSSKLKDRTVVALAKCRTRGQAAHGADDLAFELSLNDVLPIPLLPAGAAILYCQIGKDVTRHILVLNHS